MKWPVVSSFLLLTCSVSSELFSSTTDMVRLLDTEAIFIKAAQSFILKAEDRIIKLRRDIESYKDEHQLAMKNVTEFVSNPFNSHKLIKRILSNWKTIENFLSDDLSQELMRNLTYIKESMDFPTNHDLIGTMEALERIQETYNINITSLAEGNINGLKYSSQLSADDCFHLGKNSFSRRKYQNCMDWMTESLKRLVVETDISETSQWEILEHIASSVFKLGNISKAILIIDVLIKIYPDHPRAPETRMYYIQEYLKYPGVSEQKKKLISPILNKSLAEYSWCRQLKMMLDLVGKGDIFYDINPFKLQNNKKNSDKLSEDEVYKMACRKEISPPTRITSHLKCRYITNDIPFLRLAPFKEEEVYLNPKIVLFREVIYDSEIEIIKTLALPNLQPATLQNETKEYSRYRISKNVWMNDKEHPVIAALSRRVEDMTKLSIATAENLQVVNYGIGGYNALHYDYFEEIHNISEIEVIGNRIATVIFYMNDVAQGGATVFPHLRLGVWPEKGTALSWLNLLSNSRTDKNTLHAGSPVLAGTKWISTKWLSERDQAFRRPCELTPSNVMVMRNF